MPKIKTHKGAQKRFHITGTGIILRTKGMKSHFRRRKAARIKRQFDEMISVDKTDVGRIKRALPYGVP